MYSLMGRHGEEEDYWLKIQSIKNNDEKDSAWHRVKAQQMAAVSKVVLLLMMEEEMVKKVIINM